MNARKVVETADPLRRPRRHPGTRRIDRRPPTAAEHPAEALARDVIPAHRLLKGIVDAGPCAGILLVKLAADRQERGPRHELAEIIDVRNDAEEVDHAPVDVVVDLDLRRLF